MGKISDSTSQKRVTIWKLLPHSLSALNRFHFVRFIITKSDSRRYRQHHIISLLCSSLHYFFLLNSDIHRTFMTFKREAKRSIKITSIKSRRRSGCLKFRYQSLNSLCQACNLSEALQMLYGLHTSFTLNLRRKIL